LDIALHAAADPILVSKRIMQPEKTPVYFSVPEFL
jgi:hypothetical protein